MHLHAKRFWMLSYGVGDATACLNDKSYQEGTPVFWGGREGGRGEGREGMERWT